MSDSSNSSEFVQNDAQPAETAQDLQIVAQSTDGSTQEKVVVIEAASRAKCNSLFY